MKKKILSLLFIIPTFCFSQKDSLKYYSDIFKDTTNIYNWKRLEAAKYLGHYILYEVVDSEDNNLGFYRKYIKSKHSYFFKRNFFHNTYIDYVLYKDNSKIIFGRVGFYKRQFLDGIDIYTCKEKSTTKACW